MLGLDDPASRWVSSGPCPPMEVGCFCPPPTIYQTTGQILDPKTAFGSPGHHLTELLAEICLEVTDNITGQVKGQISSICYSWRWRAKQLYQIQMETRPMKRRGSRLSHFGCPLSHFRCPLSHFRCPPNSSNVARSSKVNLESLGSCSAIHVFLGAVFFYLRPKTAFAHKPNFSSSNGRSRYV